MHNLLQNYNFDLTVVEEWVFLLVVMEWREFI
jgi:hypothetical protein